MHRKTLTSSLSLAVSVLLTSCGAPAPAVPDGAAPVTAAATTAAASPTASRRDSGFWSNISGGIGYSLRLAGPTGTLVLCETGGHCTVHPVDQLVWGETGVGLRVRFRDTPEVWKASFGTDGTLRIESGIWREQLLFDCLADSMTDRGPPYLCTQGPLPTPVGDEVPTLDYSAQLRPGPSAPAWRPVERWPDRLVGILWGSEANGADPCSPVLEPPSDASEGWSRFWTWRVHAKDGLAEYTILHRVMRWNGRTDSELSVVKRRSLAVWSASAPRMRSVFLVYYPPAPRKIHPYFRVYEFSAGGGGDGLLHDRGMVDRTLAEIDPLDALARHQRGSPLEASESVDIGVGRRTASESACTADQLGVLASQRYRMRDVLYGTDEYGRLGDLLQHLKVR